MFLDYVDYLILSCLIEIFVTSCILSNKDLDFVKTRTKKAALSSLRNSLGYHIVGTRPGIMYGLCKFHKNINNVLPFRPIFSAINTPIYKLAKVLVPILIFF